MKNKPESRRSFLTKGFFNRDELIKDVASLLHEEEAQGEKVKMLTPDGKLVEVDRRILESQKSSSKASNADILEWMKGKEIEE